MSTTVSAIPTLAELCYQSIAEHLEYNSDAIKVLPIDLTERLIAYMVDRLHPRHLVMTQTRAIKIRLIKQERSCTFRFLLHGTVGHAIQQIYEKTEDGTVPAQQYGLFQPAGAFRQPRWLQEDKSLSYYDIDPSVCERVCCRYITRFLPSVNIIILLCILKYLILRYFLEWVV
jgi:hypothetical protein